MFLWLWWMPTSFPAPLRTPPAGAVELHPKAIFCTDLYVMLQDGNALVCLQLVLDSYMRTVPSCQIGREFWVLQTSRQTASLEEDCRRCVPVRERTTPIANNDDDDDGMPLPSPQNNHNKNKNNMQSSSSSSLSTRKRPRSVEPTTALALWKRRQPSTTTAQPPLLLQHPDWKLLPGTVTEIAGPAGVGKTQLALTLCADAVVCHYKAVYVVLGGSSKAALGRLSQRLETMLVARIQHRMDAAAAAATTTAATTTTMQQQQVRQWLNNIVLMRIRNTEELMDFFRIRLPQRLTEEQQGPSQSSSIRVVILDGIAQLFRHAEPYDAMNCRDFWVERAATFFQLSNLCKQLGDRHQIPFVVLNEATTRIENSPLSVLKTTPDQEDNSHHNLEPALGLSWKQSVNASFFVTASAQATYRTAAHSETLMRRRWLRCRKAPHLPAEATLSFYIDQRGTVRICE